MSVDFSKARAEMVKRRLTPEERQTLADERTVIERQQYPGATVSVAEETDDDGNPIYCVFGTVSTILPTKPDS